MTYIEDPLSVLRDLREEGKLIDLPLRPEAIDEAVLEALSVGDRVLDLIGHFGTKTIVLQERRGR